MKEKRIKELKKKLNDLFRQINETLDELEKLEKEKK